jgi:hypothetical protein
VIHLLEQQYLKIKMFFLKQKSLFYLPLSLTQLRSLPLLPLYWTSLKVIEAQKQHDFVLIRCVYTLLTDILCLFRASLTVSWSILWIWPGQPFGKKLMTSWLTSWLTSWKNKKSAIIEPCSVHNKNICFYNNIAKHWSRHPNPIWIRYCIRTGNTPLPILENRFWLCACLKY